MQMITMSLKMEVTEPIKIFSKQKELISHKSLFLTQIFVLVTKDMIFLRFGLYQISYICYELK